MRISDWSSDVCSSDLAFVPLAIGASALYAACILLVFGNAANLPVLLSWYVLTIGACLGGLRLVAGWTLAASRIEVRAVWMTAAIVALPSILWTAPALFLPAAADSDQMLTIFLVSAALIASTNLLLAIPLASLASSEEHTSGLPSLMRPSYDVFCFTK